MRRRLLSLLLPLAAVHACSAPAPRPARTAVPSAPRSLCARAVPADVVHHDVEIVVGDGALRGGGSLRVRGHDTVVAFDTKDLVIDDVSTGGVSLGYQIEPSRVCVALPDDPRASMRDVQLSWSTRPGSTSVAITPDQVWAGYHASAWMPTAQRPEVRATLSLAVVTPAAWKVAASGLREPVTIRPDGRARHEFRLDVPTPPFLFAFAAGAFEEVRRNERGVSIRALGPAGAPLANAVAVTAPMLRFLGETLDLEYQYPEYTQAFVHGDAAQEAALMALLDDTAPAGLVKDPEDDWLLAHELAHEWFAWMVPCADFSDFWLNEGFATFFVAAYKEQRWGRSAYDREVALWRKRSQKAHAEGRDAPVAARNPGLAEDRLPARAITYSRGALVLATLREELGEQHFWAGLRTYVARHALTASRATRTSDLRAALESVSERDLGPFFEAHVYAADPGLSTPR